jgi:hypothetical protein
MDAKAVVLEYLDRIGRGDPGFENAARERRVRDPLNLPDEPGPSAPQGLRLQRAGAP